MEQDLRLREVQVNVTKFEGGLSLLHRADDDTVPGLLESMCNYYYFMSAAVAAALMK